MSFKPTSVAPIANPEPTTIQRDKESFEMSKASSAVSVHEENVQEPTPPWHKQCNNFWGQLVIYSIACLLTSCIYFGWQDYKRMILRSGAYTWKCAADDPRDETENSCTEQVDSVEFLYAFANGSEFAFAAVAGLLLDSLGPKRTAILGEFLHMLSILLLLFSSEKAQMYIPAVLLAGASVNIVCFPALTMKEGWPTRQALCVAIIVGCQSAASVVTPILRVMWDHHPTWTFKKIWGVWLVVIWLPVSILYVWALPLKQNYEVKLKLPRRVAWKAFWREARTIDMAVMGAYFGLQMFQFGYFPNVAASAFGDDVSDFQGKITPIQGPGSIIIGLMMDYTGTVLVMYTMCATLLFVNLASAFGAKNPPLMKGVSFWFIFMQSATYNLKYTFVNETYDPFNFGKLVGLLGICAGIGVYMTAPLVKSHRYRVVFLSLSGIAILMIFLTSFLFWRQYQGINHKTEASAGDQVEKHRVRFFQRRKENENSKNKDDDDELVPLTPPTSSNSFTQTQGEGLPQQGSIDKA